MKTILILLISVVFCSMSMAQNTFGIGGGGNGLKVVTDTSNVAKKDGKLYQYNDNMYFGTGTSLRHVPSIGGDNVLNVDSLAARALNITGNLTVSGTLNATGVVNTPALTINSAYKFGRATGTAGQVLALTTASTPDTTYWTSYTADNGALWLRNAGAGYVYPNTATDMLGLNATPASPNKIYAINNGLAIQNNSGYKFYHMLDDTTSNPAGTYYPIGVDALTEIKTKKGQTYTIGATASGALLGNVRISGKGTVSWINCISSYPQVTDNASAASIAGFYSRSPIDNTTGTVSDYFGYYAPSYTTAGFITQGWGFYSAGASDKNYFAGSLGLGVTAPAAKLDVTATTAQLQLSYDASNKAVFATGSSGDLTITPSGGDVNIAGVLGINDATHAGTYDVEVGDSVQIGGNLLLGSYGGAWSRIKPGEGGVTSSSTQDIKLVGPEKNIVNILDLAKQVQVREWSFDSSKVYEKFVQPAGFDTLAKSAQDSIRELHEKPAKAKAGELAKKKHYTPVAENWNIVGQHFGGNSKEINSEQVMWAQFQMIQALLKRVEGLEAENVDIKSRLDKLEKPK